MKLKHKLMASNFEKSDFKSVIKLISKKNPVLTQGKKVQKFEYLWSKWLGVKYSVFVNSGSSANYLTFACLDIFFKNRKKNNVIVPSFTWISDIVSLLKNNFNPIFVDIDKKNLSLDLKQVKSKINNKTFGIFITHAQGFNGFNNEILKIAKNKNIHIIEDVCESHGANFKNKKLGSFGLISNFSFYYAHHLSTIEGGMICTNNKNIYHILRSLRSHGMARELGDLSLEKKYILENKELSPKFIFLYPGFNFRNNEIGACIGINQLKRLDSQNKKRASNLSFFLQNLDKKKYWNNYDLEGNSNYAFPLILEKKSIKNRDKLERILKKHGIEFRRGSVGGGNQLRQPYLKKLIKLKPSKFKVTDHIHFYGYYIGNYPSLKKNKILSICKILNNINYE